MLIDYFGNLNSIIPSAQRKLNSLVLFEIQLGKFRVFKNTGVLLLTQKTHLAVWSEIPVIAY